MNWKDPSGLLRYQNKSGFGESASYVQSSVTSVPLATVWSGELWVIVTHSTSLSVKRKGSNSSFCIPDTDQLRGTQQGVGMKVKGRERLKPRCVEKESKLPKVREREAGCRRREISLSQANRRVRVVARIILPVGTGAQRGGGLLDSL